MKEAAREMLVRGAADVGVPLSPVQIDKLVLFASELKRWGKRINLTAITTDEDIAIKHFVDSLTVVPLLAGGRNLLDIGSGAGFPSIPVAIVYSHLDVVSVDAVEKKIFFQRHVARAVELTQFEAIHVRAEDLRRTHGRCFDWIVSRAFSDLPNFLKVAVPLLADGGTIVAMKGKGGREEAVAAEDTIKGLKLKVEAVNEFNLPFSSDGRSLIVMRKSEKVSLD